jgi:hypothetical protein
MTGTKVLLSRWQFGITADIPQRRAAATRRGLPGLTTAAADRHFDAWLWARSCLRLPTLTLGLKEVSGYLGFRPATDVTDALAHTITGSVA